jgi:hypothetical protein
MTNLKRYRPAGPIGMLEDEDGPWLHVDDVTRLLAEPAQAPATPLLRSLRSGLEAIRPYASPHSEHTNECNGGDDGPCDCPGIRPRDVVDAMLEQITAEEPQGEAPVVDANARRSGYACPSCYLDTAQPPRDFCTRRDLHEPQGEAPASEAADEATKVESLQGIQRRFGVNTARAMEIQGFQQQIQQLTADLAHERHEKDTVIDAASAHAAWTRTRIAELEQQFAAPARERADAEALVARIAELEADASSRTRRQRNMLRQHRRYGVRLRQLTAALLPFAAMVHGDGVDAPYPEERWIPLLQAAADAYREAGVRAR